MGHEKTKSFHIDGRETLIPTVLDGVQLSDNEAVAAFREGQIESLGEFESPEEATAFAKARSDAYEPNDREVADTFIEQNARAQLAGDPTAANALNWDNIEETTDAAGTTRRTGYDQTTGVSAVLSQVEGEAPALPEPFTVIENGVEYDLERHQDGSEWLLGVLGRPRTGVASMTRPPTTEDEGEGFQNVADGATSGEGGPGGVTGEDEASMFLQPGDDREAEAAAFEDTMAGQATAAVDGVVQLIDALTDTVGLSDAQAWVEAVTAPLSIEYEEPTTAGAEITSDLVQTAAGMVPAAKIIRGLGISAQFLQWAAAGFVTDFAGFDPDEPMIGEFAAEIGRLDNEQAEMVRSLLQEALEKDMDDGEFVKRLKNASGGVIIGGVFDGVIGVIKGIRTLSKNPEFKQQMLDFLVDESGEVPLKRRGGGQYVGAAKGLDSPQKLAALRRNARNLFEAGKGEGSKFWYERSGRAILEMFGGDVDEAEMFAKFVAVTSPEAPVKGNLEWALRAWNQYKTGGTLQAGKYPNSIRKSLESVLAGGEVTGNKRRAFYANLMQTIDPSRVLADQVTVDRWMLDAFGFKRGTTPTDAQYEFVANETRRIAEQVGWEPHQVQAAIWVANKARVEGTEIGTAAFDFSTAIAEFQGQISWEAIPHTTSGHLVGLETAPAHIKAEYHYGAAQAFLDDEGRDMLAKALGMASDGSFEAPGAYKGGVQPGTQTKVAIPWSANKGALDPDTVLLLNAYAALRGRLLRQEAIAWHLPVYQTSADAANGTEFRGFGRPLTEDETDRVYQAIIDAGGDPDWAPISTPDGFRVLNFSDRPNPEFSDLVHDATDRALPDLDDKVEEVAFRSEGDYLFNDWKGSPDGQDYAARISEAGRPDLQERADGIYAEVAARLDAFDAEFAGRHGFTGRPRLPGGGDQALTALSVAVPGAGIAALGADGEDTGDETQVAGLWDRLLKPLLRGAADVVPTPKPKLDPAIEQKIVDTYAEYHEGPLQGQRIAAPDADEGVDFNFDNLDTYDDALGVLNTLSEANAKAITDNKFGAIPLKVTRQVADLLGADEDTALDAILSLPGDVRGLHVRALAMRDLLVKMAETVDRKAYELAQRPTQVTDEELLDFKEHVAKLTAMHSNAKGVQTEIARALSAYRIPAETPDLARAQLVQEMLSQAGGRDTIKQLADLWLKTPVAGRAKLIEHGLAAKSVEVLREIWINGLLSGLRTHEINIVSNMLFGAWQIPERAIAATIGSVRAGLERGLMIGNASDRVYQGEAMSQLFGFVEGVPDAFRLAWGTFKSDVPQNGLAKVENYSHKAISSGNLDIDEASIIGRFVDLVGTGIRLPGRALMTMDEFNKGIARQMERRARAYREANMLHNQGSTDAESVAAYNDILSGTNKKAEDGIDEFADMVTFTRALGEHGTNFQKLARKIPGGWLVAPFLRTPINILKETLQRTPVAPFLFKEVRAEYAAGGARRDLAIAKIASGTALGMWATHLSGQGIITGAGPADYEMQMTWRQKFQPYSINMRKVMGEEAWIAGGYEHEWVPYGRLAPMGDIMGIWVDIAEYRQWAPRDMADEAEATLATMAVGSTISHFKDKTFFTGIADFMEAFNDPARYMERYVARLGGSMMPYSSQVRDVNSAIDPTRRDTRGDPYENNPVYAAIGATLQELRARTPGLSSDMPPRLNHWGEDVVAYEGEWYNAFNAFAPRANKAEPIDEALIELGYPMRMPKREIAGVKLDAHRYHALVTALNTIELPHPADPEKSLNMRDAMNYLVESPLYHTLFTEDLKIKAIQATREAFLDEAKRQMTTPGSQYFDAELMGWTLRAKIQKPLGMSFAP
jgi:hypothetical protein